MLLRQRSRTMTQGNQFMWFYGIVEDVNDSLKLGRVRVRCLGYHHESQNILPTNNLPWAEVVNTVTSSGQGNVGHTPVGMEVDTWVFGFFKDGDMGQRPVVVGTHHGIPAGNDQPDTNQLARNDSAFPHPVLQLKEDSRTKDVSTSIGTTWSEPPSAYSASYPSNAVSESRSGHINEVDDTPGNQRLHRYHRSGTFEEIDSNGQRVTRIVNDQYTIVAGDDFVNIKGDVNLTIDGNCNQLIKGNYELVVEGNKTETVIGKSTVNNDINVAGDITTNNVNTGNINSSGNVDVSGNLDVNGSSDLNN